MKLTGRMILLASLIFSSPIHASPWSRNELMLEMAEAMLDMARLWNRMQNTSQGSLWATPLQPSPLAPNIPSFQTEDTGFIDGAWIGQDDSLLIIFRGLARLYLDVDHYQDFYIKVDNGWVYLANPQDRSVHRYEVRLADGLMALRDSTGTVIGFSRQASYPQSR